VSATVAVPQRYKNVVDVIGAVDWFGWMNSLPSLGVEHRAPQAWHHTNTELWFHLPVCQVFTDLAKTHEIALRH
jgi:hypothetical protein